MELPAVDSGRDGIDERQRQRQTVAAQRQGAPPSPRPSGADDELPTNVSAAEQLRLLPPEFLSGDSVRPLRYDDESGGGGGGKEAAAEASVAVYRYALRPMSYSVAFILLVELLERFCFYGVQYTQTSYLTGAYDPDWNAGFDSVSASSLVSASTAVAYTAPFLGALAADRYLGDYRSVLLGTSALYIPGVALIACTTVPGLLGDRFNGGALTLGLIGLWPVGTGMIKSVINVFGAKQFHPVVQSSLIESYYVNFYMCINIGALAGGVVIPVVAQHDVTAAYFIPVAMLFVGLMIFAAGTPRYVRGRPRGELFGAGKGGDDTYAPPSDEGMGLSIIAKVSALIVPFNIAYSQMATTFIVQGTVMERALGWIDAASMNNCDALSVLFFGYVVGTWVYPALARRGIKLGAADKFAIGSLLGALAIGWALVVEHMIRSAYRSDGGGGGGGGGGRRISVLWQAPSYVLIGAGEIFAVSAAYEVAFTVAPPERKALASAINLFFVGAVPNLVCVGLYRACLPWFRNDRGDASISRPEDYVRAEVGRYFGLMLAISATGAALNLSPAVRRWMAGVEEGAAELVRTPNVRMTPRARRAAAAASRKGGGEEGSALLSAKKHQQYLKYGKGPVLNRLGSMRAGVVLGKRGRDAPVTRRKYQIYGNGLVLYKGKPVGTGSTSERGEADGKHAVSERTYGSTMDEERPPVAGTEDAAAISNSTL